MNMNLFIFEFKKILKQKKNIFFLSFSVTFVILFLILNYTTEKIREEERIKSLNFSVEERSRVIKDLPKILEGREQTEIEAIVESEKDERELIEKQIIALESNNWEDYLRIQLILDQNFLKGIKDGSLFGGEPIESVEYRIAMNNELLQNNIEPTDELYSTKGFNFLNSVMSYAFSYVGIILIVFFIGDKLSRELEKGTIKFLFTQPISRISALNSKFIFAVLSSLLLILVVALTSFISGSLISGTGTINYPIHQLNNEITFINIADNLLRSGLLFIFIIIFIVSLTLLFATISSNSIISIGLPISLLGLFAFSTERYDFLSNIAHLLPFTYINTPIIINGYFAESLNNPNVNLENGIIITLISSVIIYSFNIYLLNKKDIL